MAFSSHHCDNPRVPPKLVSPQKRHEDNIQIKTPVSDPLQDTEWRLWQWLEPTRLSQDWEAANSVLLPTRPPAALS